MTGGHSPMCPPSGYAPDIACSGTFLNFITGLRLGALGAVFGVDAPTNWRFTYLLTYFDALLRRSIHQLELKWRPLHDMGPFT